MTSWSADTSQKLLRLLHLLVARVVILDVYLNEGPEHRGYWDSEGLGNAPRGQRLTVLTKAPSLTAPRYRRALFSTFRGNSLVLTIYVDPPTLCVR